MLPAVLLWLHFFRAEAAHRFPAAGKAELIGDETDGQGRQNVQHRVLLHEQGGDTDQQRGQGKGQLPAPMGQPPAMPGGEHHRQRADHMDGGADVGIGIELIEAGNEGCQQVIPGEGRRAQVLAGGPDQVHKEGGTVCKGDEMHQEAYKLLKNCDKINFTGNVEGRDLLSGDIDVIVTDGFSGNIALKASEGAAILLMKALKESLFATLRGKIGALFAKTQLYALKDRFDYKSVGGALFMGFEKAIVKAHGSSDAKAVYNAMELVYRMVDLDVVGRMKEGLQ